MRKRNLFQKIKLSFSRVEKKSKIVVKSTGEMTGQLEKMGKLGGQLFVMRAG